MRDIVLLFVLGLVVFATRLPWVNASYGIDGDSFRVVLAARALSETGQYEASRLPGFPIHEYVTSFMVTAGPVATNCATAFLSMLAFYSFLSILCHFHIPNSVLLSVAFALTPVIYINSTCTIDYIWALAFSLLSTALVIRGRPALWAGGISLGMAIGCRITSGAMIVPLVSYLWMNHEGKRRYEHAIVFLATVLLVGSLCYVSVWKRYGLDFLIIY
jgi:hypothetical protein